MSDAVLIGARPEDGMFLSQREYAAVKNLIRLHRLEGSKEADAIFEAVYCCDENWCRELEVLSRFLNALLCNLGETQEERYALFTDGADRLLFLGEEDGEEQAACVAALIQILQDKNWFSEFLLYFLPHFVKGKRTPLEVMWKLSEQASSFESDINHARDMLKEWPELVQPEAVAATAGV